MYIRVVATIYNDDGDPVANRMLGTPADSVRNNPDAFKRLCEVLVGEMVRESVLERDVTAEPV